MKQAYGIEYQHGSNVKNGTVTVYAFFNATVRNHWVRNGSAYTGPGERKALNSNSKLLRRAQLENTKGLSWPITLTD